MPTRAHHSTSTSRWTGGFGLLCLVLATAAPAARAQVADPKLWTTNALVRCMARDGNTLYIGGDFDYVGPQTGSFARLDLATGAPSPSWPRVEGIVRAIASDGAGGWYLGGDFDRVGGHPRAKLARLRADGSLDPWNPGANARVSCIAFHQGVVYVGGDFTAAGGQPRNHLAAFDGTTGLVAAWNPGANGWIRRLAPAGSSVYVGGDFTVAGGQSRSRIAEISTVTGAATAWNPGANNGVLDIVVNGSTIYACGWFTSAGGQPRSRLVALDASTGAATAWNPSPNAEVDALVLSGGVLYAGGDFTSLAGQSRDRLAAFDAASGALTAWNPGANALVLRLAAGPGALYAVGNFTAIGGQSRRQLAAIDMASAVANAWAPISDQQPYALAADSAVAIGGAFGSVGGVLRSNLAAIDLSTGAPTAWAPSMSGNAGTGGVGAILVANGHVIVGGGFTQIGGQFRNRLAALDPVTGQASAWNPGLDGWVSKLARVGDTLFVAGSFLEAGGQPRARLAALSLSTGAAFAWNPSLDGAVGALAVHQGRLYAGGSFLAAGGQTRRHLAAWDLATGALTSWNPDANDVVASLAARGGLVYFGGIFTYVGGPSTWHPYLAAVDATTGSLSNWAPYANNWVLSVAADESHVYAAGYVSSVALQERPGASQLDPVSGVPTAWNPAPNAPPSLVQPDGDVVYFGGDFWQICGSTRWHFAAVLPAPESPPGALALAPGGGRTLLVGETEMLEWSSSAPAPGTQDVDLYISRTGPSGPWEPVALAVPDNGRWPWTVTAPVASSSAYLRIDVRDWAGNVGTTVSPAAFSIALPGAGVEEGVSALDFAPPMPNPVRESVRLSFTLREPASASLVVHDVSGRETRRVAARAFEAGRHSFALETRAWKPGLYFASLRVHDVTLTRRIVVTR